MGWRWLAAVMAVVWALGAAAAETGVLRVGTVFDRPPLSYQDGGQWVGMEADFARVLAAQLGRKLQPVVLERSALLSALQRGEIIVGDAHAGELAEAGVDAIGHGAGRDELVDDRLGAGDRACLGEGDGGAVDDVAPVSEAGLAGGERERGHCPFRMRV